MGTRPPSEPAPAYNELFDGHHERPSNNMSGYTLVPTDDISNTAAAAALDIEQHEHIHSHSHSHSRSSRRNNNNTEEHIILDLPASVANAAAAATATEQHIHCEACDRLIERKQTRANQRHCCTMVAVTFIVAFLCLMILGIVVVQGGKA